MLPGPIWAFSAASSVVHVRGRPGLVQFLLDVVGVAADVLEHPGLQQLVQGPGPRLHGGDLVLRPLQRRSRITSVFEIPATLSFTELIALAAVYWAFSVSSSSGRC